MGSRYESKDRSAAELATIATELEARLNAYITADRKSFDSGFRCAAALFLDGYNPGTQSIPRKAIDAMDMSIRKRIQDLFPWRTGKHD